jgi:hypothetical protein
MRYLNSRRPIETFNESELAGDRLSAGPLLLSGMITPSIVPDWAPGWLPIVVLVPVLLYAVAFLALPFGVFGLKSRLDVIEARLDEIQGEIRLLSLRLPERGNDGPDLEAAQRTNAARLPIPPSGSAQRLYENNVAEGRSGVEAVPRRWSQDEADVSGAADRSAPRRRSRDRSDRAEPRLEWPR